jgi:hypothetical protein
MRDGLGQAQRLRDQLEKIRNQLMGERRMKVKVVMCAALFAALVGVTAASAYDRLPVKIDHATVDGFGATTSVAEKKVRTRYRSAKSIRCVGAVVKGSTSPSSWMSGGYRVWDKFVCKVGTVSKTRGVKLIFDVKGEDGGFLIYRVKPWTSAAAVSRPTTKPATASSNGGSVVGISQGELDLTKITAGVNPDRSVTVNWNLKAKTDASSHFNLWWELDGQIKHNYNESDDGRTQLRTPPLSPGRHTVSVTTDWLVWTNTYYGTGDCRVSSRGDYIWYCGWDDTATATVNIR